MNKNEPDWFWISQGMFNEIREQNGKIKKEDVQKIQNKIEKLKENYKKGDFKL